MLKIIQDVSQCNKAISARAFVDKLHPKRKDTKLQKMVLPGGWDTDFIPPGPKKKARRMKRRNLIAIVSIALLLCLIVTAASAFALLKFKGTLFGNAVYHNNPSNMNYQSQSMHANGNNQPVTTINGLTKISVIGTTAFIVDGHGKTISVDPHRSLLPFTPPTFTLFQIGQLTQINGGTKINATWVPSLQIGGHQYSDVLLALDLANNRVAAYPNSTTLNTTAMRSTSKGMTAFQGKPLNMPAGLTINPLNGDLLVVNMNDNNLVELNLSQGKAVGTHLLDNVPVDAQSGNGSALFGVAAAKDGMGNLEVFFTDDNLNTLNVLSM